MLHIRCGEDILGKLEAAGVPGRKLSWADPLCEGPWLPYERAFARPVRARFLAERYALDFMSSLDTLATADEALEGAADEDEVVLWFEHDLFDQPILAHRAVEAWSAADPLPLDALRRPDPALPHLAAAIERYLAEYPSVRNGLALSEQLALEAIAAGAGTAHRVFAKVQARERAPWMGDAMLFARLRALSEGAAPLLRVDGAWPMLDDAESDPGVALSDIGRQVLAGEEDWLAVQPQERWMGGVHLRPGGTAWRWDAAAAQLVQRR